MLPGIDDLQLDDHNEIPDCAVGASSSPKGIAHTALFFSEDGKYSTAVFMDAFKAVCADMMACLLPRFLIYCCCTSSLQTKYISSCIAKMWVFASTRHFLRSSITSPWFSKGWQVPEYRCSVPQFLDFFNSKSAARSLFCVCSAWKAFLTRSRH